MLSLTPPQRLARFRQFVFWMGLVSATIGWAQDSGDGGLEDVTVLPPFRVKGVQMEDFGLRFGGQFGIPSSTVLIISEIFPNTAAARSGLRPGERVSKIDGKSVSFFSMLSLVTKPQKLQQRKWAELEKGKKSTVSLVLEVYAPNSKETRNVTLVLPSPAPHWGSEKWSAPEGRTPAVVTEAGPLAALAREVLDNGIWTGTYETTGYEWRIVQPSGMHRIRVTQQHGKTDISLEYRSPATGRSEFSASPSGAMERASGQPPKKRKLKETPPEELRAQFEAEIDFWLHKVGRVSGRWPFEALPNKTPLLAGSGSVASPPEPNAARAESFLKLPVATSVQKDLFFAALGKVGLDADCWAFTETSRSFEDDRVTTLRYDPSKPPTESSTLLKVDGKAPKPAYLKQWRDEGHEPLPGLGELPPLSNIVDVDDVRIFADETTAVVFELPVKASNEEFPADKFLARFRVNKTTRGFEDFSVKLREAISVKGIAKVTDAGLEARFQTFDPTLAPQPVLLKVGGGVRVLFVKFSRAFEVKRTDFKKVVPFEGEVLPVLGLR
ncbi:MAG: hypothetical protein ABIO94_07930 [Opitutaceae bacterium]